MTVVGARPSVDATAAGRGRFTGIIIIIGTRVAKCRAETGEQPSVLKETGTSVSARGRRTRTWGGAGAARVETVDGPPGRRRGSERAVALAGAAWGGVDGSSAVGAKGDGGGAIRVLSRAKEGEDGGTRRGVAAKKAAGGGRGAFGGVPFFGDDRRANGRDRRERGGDDDGRAVRRARREDEDERSVGERRR